MKTIKWGIIGVGDVCEVKSGPGFQEAPNSELISVMRRDGEKAKDFARRHGVPKWSDSADALLSDPDIHAIYIATPPVHHLEYTRAALTAGKHVYVEKPMALNVAEAREMRELAEASPNKVCVAHYRRQLPLYQKIDAVVQSGELGSPRYASIQLRQTVKNDLNTASEANWRVQPEVSGGGLFHDLVPHQFDLLLKYFGEPEFMQGFSLRRNPEGTCDDCVSGQMRFEGEVVFQGYWDFASKVGGDKDSCQIVCDQGTINFGFFSSSTVTIESDRGIESISMDPPSHIVQPLIEAVNRYFSGNGENPCSTAVGLQVMEMIDAFTSPC